MIRSAYMLKLKTITIISIILVLLVASVTSFYIYNLGQNNQENKQIDQNNTAVEMLTKEPEVATLPDSSGPSIQNSHEFTIPNQVAGASENLTNQTSTTEPKTDSLPIPFSDKTGQPNTLEFPNLKIKSPILYSSLEDIFEKNKDGSINYQKPIRENLKNGPLSTPIQRLLTKGIVHLAFTPNPGEFGNSYIVGHSSNYPSVKSDYNEIFKNLGNAKIGDEFIIYNSEGKGIVFKVFENLAVDSDDTEIAYKDFKDKRVVTLQASILVNGQPLKRRLVRGVAG